MINIKINGKKIQAEPRSTIIQVADQIGIDIPRFCYHKKLTVAANCRMCLVEVKNFNKPLPACATTVLEGMEVFTKSEFTKDAQKSVMEFLLINHPLDCPICDEAGECDLQDIAVAYGSNKTRYTEEKRVVFDKNIGPLISTDLTRCIQCTRCVRFLKEVGGVMELGLVGRGEHVEISAYVDKAVESELSGNIIDLCPVGALTSKPFRYSARSWELIRRASISTHDSLGSNIEVHLKNNFIKRVIPKENELINECWISDRDRFSYEGLYHKDRLKVPLVKRRGKWVEVGWQEVYAAITKELKKNFKKNNTDSIGLLLSPQSTLEEGFLLKKIADQLKTPHIDYRLSQLDFSSKNNWLGCGIQEIDSLESVLVIGFNMRHEQPLLTHRFRKMVKNNGNIALINAFDDDHLIPISYKVICLPSDYANYLLMILKAIQNKKGTLCSLKSIAELLKNVEPSNTCQKIANNLLKAKNGSAIFLGQQALDLNSTSQLQVLAKLIAEEVNGIVGAIPQHANSVGFDFLGIGSENSNTTNMLKKKRSAYIMMNFDPNYDYRSPELIQSAIKGSQCSIAITPYMSDAFKDFNFILPMTPFTETSGTYINLAKEVQSFKAVSAPFEQARPGWKILRVLANFLALDGFDYDSTEQIKKEIFNTNKNFMSEEVILKNDFNQDELKNKKNMLEVVSVIRAIDSDMIVRRADSLHRSDQNIQNLVLIHPSTLEGLNLKSESKVCIKRGLAKVNLTVSANPKVSPGAIVIFAKQSTTFSLGLGAEPVKVEKVAT